MNRQILTIKATNNGNFAKFPFLLESIRDKLQAKYDFAAKYGMPVVKLTLEFEFSSDFPSSTDELFARFETDLVSDLCINVLKDVRHDLLEEGLTIHPYTLT